jgi:hydroxypyruvate reductase
MQEEHLPFFDKLFTRSMIAAPRGDCVARILATAIQAVEPGIAVKRYFRREGDLLYIGNHLYDLSEYSRVFLIGAGKASAPMAYTSAEILGEHLSEGIIIVKEGYLQSQNSQESESDQNSYSSRLTIIEAGHPIPDQRGVQSTGRIIKLLEKTRSDDLVIALISGGGSALLTSPITGVTLQDIQGITGELLACGANITEINTLRKHLDQVKGGGLARMAAPATLATLILSDVIGDPLDIIASGPTVPDMSTYDDAYLVLDRYGITERIPHSILANLVQGIKGEILETPKPGDLFFSNTNNTIIASNRQAAQAALYQAQAEGFNTLLLTTYLQGEAHQAGLFLTSIALQINATGQPLNRPACIVAGGETTVTVKGKGLGGRNQELALGAVANLAGLSEMTLVTLATDGGDGPTDAAGAVVTGETLNRASQYGLDPNNYLRRNDAYHFFEPLGDLLKPGPTFTNVNDLTFLFAF